jgi:hypothetical protein
MAITNFLRPILPCIRYSLIGIPVQLFDTNLPLLETNTISHTTATITHHILLPQYLTQIFSNWHTTTLPWLHKFSSLLPPILNTEHSEFHTSPYLHDPEADPFPILKQELQALRLASYHTFIQSQTLEIRTIESSLRSPFTSLALTSLPLTYAAYRLPPSLFTIALQRKLRIPLTAIPTTCTCHSAIDPYGDHFFSCKSLSKTSIHNRMRDSLYYITSHLSPLANITNTATDVSLEPTGLLPTFPTIRPADISLHIVPGSLHSPTSKLLIDVTILPMPHVVTTNDSYLTSVIGLHEKHENSKFTGKHGRYNSTALREPILQEILLKRYTLLPFTIDPGGQIGPLAATFLWPHLHQPTTTIHSTNRSTTNLSLPLANQLLIPQMQHILISVYSAKQTLGGTKNTNFNGLHAHIQLRYPVIGHLKSSVKI